MRTGSRRHPPHPRTRHRHRARGGQRHSRRTHPAPGCRNVPRSVRLQFRPVTDASRRTAADDDALVERLHALAWSTTGAAAADGCPPDRPFPPITKTEIEQVERQLGYELPLLLRRIYTEIGDGGFGPENGLASLTPRRVPHWHQSDWPLATSPPTRYPGWGPPASWLFLTGGGCSMQWLVSLTAIDNPVLLWDADGWEPHWGENPHDGLRYATPSLRHWLWTWADGGWVWDEALKIM
ncbi:SMI1/KNR4 family protein [Kitasatospora sp. NPDC101447]|uniref:SMI1/KNR4 family protein n=1 Tax=Kitasatospora sp. NPDC101447 TaxID=3364102 RepID=UPI00382D3468